MLRGLDKRISQKTKLPVYVAEDPLRAVARGTGIAKKYREFPILDSLKRIYVKHAKPVPVYTKITYYYCLLYWNY